MKRKDIYRYIELLGDFNLNSKVTVWLLLWYVTKLVHILILKGTYIFVDLPKNPGKMLLLQHCHVLSLDTMGFFTRQSTPTIQIHNGVKFIFQISSVT